MKIFYWILLGIGVFLAVGTVFSFFVGMAFNAELWLQRARRLRHWLWLLLLFSFNFWVWGSVAYTLFHWKSG